MGDTWITELTPLAFLERSAGVYPDKTAIVHGRRRWTYAEFARDAQRLARGLRAAGVRRGDRVACLLPNVPAMLHAHFGVPLAGAILVAVNTRLAPDEVRHILDHSGAGVLIVDSALLGTVEPVRDQLETVREIVVHTDPEGPDGGSGADGYAELLARGEAGEDLPWTVDDERSTISINYTSGTTGRPKGVQYHHRGAYLNAWGEVVHSAHDPASVYLWTLPMFHCNGWCTPWALTAIGGTHVCLREVRGDAIWRLIGEHGVSHLNGAPTVLTTIMNAPQARTLTEALVVTTAGAPPSPTTILEMERMGFRIVHVYGLTETYGPYTVCQWQDAWAALEPEDRARTQARQGVAMIQADGVRVVELLDPDPNADTDPDGATLVDVPADGTTLGEIVMRGNNVMSGYYREPEATARAFAGGWYHSGDLGVMHPDGYVELRDRAKDVIVSGGENISTVEVEQAVLSHPDVLEAAVVGVPDDRWGERPKAFVVAREGRTIAGDDVLAHVRARIARYKCPREVVAVDELPKTSTGKIQKFELRAAEWGGRERRIQG